MPVRFWHGAPNFIFFGSSVVEHISHKDDVIGSIPIQRTINLFYGGVSGIGYGLACKVMLCAFKSHLRLQFWLVSSVPTFKALRSIRRLCGVPCEGNARLWLFLQSCPLSSDILELISRHTGRKTYTMTAIHIAEGGNIFGPGSQFRRNSGQVVCPLTSRVLPHFKKVSKTCWHFKSEGYNAFMKDKSSLKTE